MIVYDLQCHLHGHRFEGWFGSSDDFARQQERGILACPHCGTTDVTKAPMAPAVPRKGNQQAASVLPDEASASPSAASGTAPIVPVASHGAGPLGGGVPPEMVRAMQALAQAQAEALKSSRWVGDKFVDQSRAIHYGETDAEPIHGEATPDQAKALLEEGIEIAPLLFPLAPPDKIN